MLLCTLFSAFAIIFTSASKSLYKKTSIKNPTEKRPCIVSKNSVCKEKALKENGMTLKLFKTNLRKNSVMPLLIRVFVTFRVSHFS